MENGLTDSQMYYVNNDIKYHAGKNHNQFKN